MDNEFLNQNEEEAKEEQKEMEQEEKNPMPSQEENGSEAKTGDAENASQSADEGATENPVPDQAGDAAGGETAAENAAQEPEQETTVEKLTGKVNPMLDSLKEKGDNLFESGIKFGRGIYDKVKDKGFSLYDTVMNFKDDIHYGKKELLKRVKTGVAGAKEKAANTKLGKWFAKKKEEREAKKAAEAEKPKEPGFFSKLWGKVKTGVAAAKEKVVNSKFAGAVRSGAEKVKNAMVNNPVVQAAKTGVSAVKSKLADSKLGKWIGKKMEERAAKKAAEAGKPKEPGLLSRAFTSVKTGVTALKDKVVNSKLGQRVSKEITKGKEWIGEQKKWLDAKKERLNEEKNKLLDEVDDHEHERRMAYESKRDPEYRKHYDELLDELRQNPGIKDLQGSVSRGEIDEFMNKMESGKDEDEESKGQKIGGFLEDNSDKIEEYAPEVTRGKMSEDTASGVASGVSAAGSFIKMGDNIGTAISATKKRNEIEALAKTDEMKDDALSQRVASYAADAKNKEGMNASFDALQNFTSGVGSVADIIPGGELVSKVASGLGKGVQLVQKMANSSLDKQTRKMGLKGIIGGVKGYKALKSKYNLKAPEMRRAMREVLGMRTEDDVVNADRANISNKMAKRIDSKDSNAMKMSDTLGAKTNKEIFKTIGGQNISTRSYSKKAAAAQ